MEKNLNKKVLQDNKANVNSSKYFKQQRKVKTCGKFNSSEFSSFKKLFQCILFGDRLQVQPIPVRAILYLTCMKLNTRNYSF